MTFSTFLLFVLENIRYSSLIDIFSLNDSPVFQSQPCHWRNAKNVVKRSVPEIDGLSTPATSLSENVNLFQSLRVLQEGEADTELFQNSTNFSRSGKTDIIYIYVYVKHNFLLLEQLRQSMHLSQLFSIRNALLFYLNCIMAWTDSKQMKLSNIKYYK